MDLIQLKAQIYNDNNIIPLLEHLRCEYIHEEQSGDLICAQLPDEFDSKNKRSIQIKNNENLTSHIRSRDISGNIYNIVGYILYECTDFETTKENLYQITQYICNVLDYEPGDFKSQPQEKKEDWLWFLRPIQKDRKQILTLDEIPENNPLFENVMEQYINYLHIDWYKAGINSKTKEIFDIRYCLKNNRIIFPVHNFQGEIIGVKGRYVFESKDEEENSDIPKYLFLYPFFKSIELFNLHRAYDEIRKRKQVIILESEKATMLATQWEIKNCLSIMGGDLTPVQVYKLKQLGINIELIFMWDKDKDEEFIKKQLNQIRNRKVKYMWDEGDLLKNKDSPTDMGETVFKKLLNEYTKEL